MKTKEDKRVVKTKAKIKTAFALLLQEKPVQEIRVMEIAEKANINRGTFYQHYKDVFDLLEKIEKETSIDFYSVLMTYSDSFKASNGAEKNIFKSFFIEVLKYIQENSEITSALFGQHGNRQYLLTLQDYVKRMMIKDLQNKHINADDLDYLFGYISAGTIESIRHWIDSGFQKPIEELASLMQLMIIKGISYYN